MILEYQKLYSLEKNLYLVGSPVIIEEGFLLIDSCRSHTFAKVILRNISDRTIIRCRISIDTKDFWGKHLESVDSYIFDNIVIEPGASVGNTTLIPLSSIENRKIFVYVREICYEDGSGWETEKIPWIKLANQKLLKSSLQDNRLIEEYKSLVGTPCIFEPSLEHGIFRCTCGAISLYGNSQCYKCRRTVSEVLDSYNFKELLEKSQVREIMEQAYLEEQRRLTEEQTKLEKQLEEQRNIEVQLKRKALRKRIRNTSAAIIFTAILAGSLWAYGIPYYLVKSANASMNSGDYETALEKYNKVLDMTVFSDFMNASYMVDTGIYQRQGDDYLLEQEYGLAIAAYEKAGDEESIFKTYYEKGLWLLEQDDYESAIEAFEQSNGFSDSYEKISMIYQRLGDDAYGSEEYQTAIEYYTKADDANGLMQCYYMLGIEAKNSGDIQVAIDYLNNCVDYNDAQDILNSMSQELFNSTLTKVKEGQYVEIGRYQFDSEKKPISWLVLKVENGKALLLSKDIIELSAFGASGKWEDSLIRKWLNNDFMSEAFNSYEIDRIVETPLTTDGVKTKDKVFVLSLEEIVYYFSGKKYDSNRLYYGDYVFNSMDAKVTPYAAQKHGVSRNFDYWMTRNTMDRMVYTICGNELNGGSTNVDIEDGVRPAFWLRIE